jgi:predicted nucleotidyltransferase
MIDAATLQKVVQRLIAVAQPSRIILFGSYGRGDADEGSDLDLVVALPEVTDKHGEMIRLHKAVGDVGLGVDVLVYSEAEYLRRSQVPGTLLYWARTEGKHLYESTAEVGGGWETLFDSLDQFSEDFSVTLRQG